MSDPISSVAAQTPVVATQPIAPAETKKPEETTGTAASAPAPATPAEQTTPGVLAKSDDSEASGSLGAGIDKSTPKEGEAKKLYLLA